MPSPIGHALGGVAAGWLAARPRTGRQALIVQAAVLATLGAAPDLDLLVHDHRAATHSVGAAVLVAAIAAWRAWPIGPTRTRVGIAAFAAWLSHPLLDMVAADTSRPFGVMFLWPFSTAYFDSGWAIFAGIHRNWWEPTFWTHNLAAGLREVAVLGPVCMLVWWLRTRAWSPRAQV
jgi:inner membrane protein